MELSYFFNKLKDVKIKDYLALLKALLARFICVFYKKYNGCWVVCEEPKEARDNGYHFFRYMRKNHKEIKCFYAIDFSSSDYFKVKKLGHVIKHGSLLHWVMYFSAEYNISSQKGGKPNAAACAFIELNHLYNSHFVFLQHGITINNITWAHSDVTPLDYFICAIQPEYEYIKANFGYKEKQLKLAGFSRFDNLHDYSLSSPKRIIVMPTWRHRFILNSEKRNGDILFEESEYYKEWYGLLSSSLWNEICEKNNVEVIFFPHRNLQPFLDKFEGVNSHVSIMRMEEHDIQEEMKKAAFLITDYSSVFFDMVYMKKPVVFFQFDYEEFRARDYKEGYFDYKNSPFGKSCETQNQVFEEICKIIQNEYIVSEEYLNYHKQVFTTYDTNNSKRIYEILARKKS